MNKLISAIAALAILITPALSADNAVVVTPGSGVTMKSKDVGGGVQSMQNILSDTSGSPIYGTAGSANTNVLTVQGIASGTPFPVAQSGTWNINNVSGTVSLPTGASTAANQSTGNTTLSSILTALNSPFQAGGSIGNTSFGAATSPIGTNPTSTLTLTSSTTAYTAGQLMANSGTAGSVVNPSFAIANSAGAAMIPRVRLSTNDTTGTAWGGQTIQVDLWTATPTWTNGDRGTWSPATGAGSHLGAYTCVMSAEYGDGAFAECSPQIGSFSLVKLASGTSIFWSLKATTGSGVTGASKVFTLTAEVLN